MGWEKGDVGTGVRKKRGESNDHPGYALQGRLMAVGYMKGLMEAIIKGG